MTEAAAPALAVRGVSKTYFLWATPGSRLWVPLLHRLARALRWAPALSGWLDARALSRLLTSQDVQEGNITKVITGSTGTCAASNSTGVTGKMRLTVTGEMGSMEVQNFLRNGTSAGSINTNVNNDDN